MFPDLEDLQHEPVSEKLDHAFPKSAYWFLLAELIAGVHVLYYYQDFLRVHPHLGPTLLGAVSAVFAQSISQIVKRKHSPNKLAKFTCWGALNGMCSTLWIDFVVTRTDNVIWKVVLDQTIGAPMFQLFFTLLSTVWDTKFGSSASLRAMYFKSLRYSFYFWPFMSVAMFCFIPESMMFLFNNVASFGWNMILCTAG